MCPGEMMTKHQRRNMAGCIFLQTRDNLFNVEANNSLLRMPSGDCRFKMSI